MTKRKTTIFVSCWRGCGRKIEILPARYSRNLVCGECWYDFDEVKNETDNLSQLRLGY